MPPPPVVCPGCQAHAQHCQTPCWSPGRPEKTELLEASGLHTADLRGKDATIRGLLVHPGLSRRTDPMRRRVGGSRL
ncbi:unnamed protein product [Pleuronectes platessa]|uniref:Uncharacterized protein n=1 Tax=Pleuronectes platessa TaxID=8262 RepID=A0A9N7UYC2_PLEPL|nr:unnamed protein product [Pleuronectes platessa]